MGLIQYTTIVDKACCGGVSTEYQIPIGSTPHEIATLTGMSIHKAIELSERAIEKNKDICPTLYFNVEITDSLQKNNCQYGVGGSVSVTIPANKYSSQLSQLEANRKAQEEFDNTAQSIANQLGTCTTFCNDSNCPSEIVKSINECGEFRRKQRCLNGTCIEFGDVFFICTGNCRSEICLEPCTTCSTQCPTGVCIENHTCVNGICVPNCEGQPCSRLCRNGYCPQGSDCINGQCSDIPISCTVCSTLCPTGSCPNGQTCVKGICTPNCTGQPCSRTCRNGECPTCFNCQEGECVRPNCSTGQVLNTTTCKCEPIPCDPTCTEYRNFDLDTECRIAFTSQRCVNKTCVDVVTRFENKLDNTTCTGGICNSGACQTECIPDCVQNKWIQDTAKECQESRQKIECVNAVCTPTIIEFKNKPNGTSCIDGECQEGVCTPPPTTSTICGIYSGGAASSGFATIIDSVFPATFKGYIVFQFSTVSKGKFELFKATSYPENGVPNINTFSMPTSGNGTSTSSVGTMVATTGQKIYNGYDNQGTCITLNNNGVGCGGFAQNRVDINTGKTISQNINTIPFTPTSKGSEFSFFRQATGNVDTSDSRFIGVDLIYDNRILELQKETGIVGSFLSSIPFNVDGNQAGNRIYVPLQQLVYTRTNGSVSNPELFMFRSTKATAYTYNIYLVHCFPD